MSSGHAEKIKHPPKPTVRGRRVSPFTLAGLSLIGIACFIILATYWPILMVELGYDIHQITPHTAPPKPMTPVDLEYGIMIPKIGANAHVIANVNPYDSRAYQAALTKGVAQATGTGIPGNPGNIFLFSHSSANFYEAARYNSVFYLLTKLGIGDQIVLYYQRNRYLYAVTAKETVKPTAVQYLRALDDTRQTVTLMTCWPPGTSFERLLIIAERIPYNVPAPK